MASLASSEVVTATSSAIDSMKSFNLGAATTVIDNNAQNNLFAPEINNSSSNSKSANTTVSAASTANSYSNNNNNNSTSNNSADEFKSHYRIDNKYWLNPSYDDFEFLTKHISEQIDKGHGEAHIYIGQSGNQNGFNETELELATKTLTIIKEKLNVSAVVLQDFKPSSNPNNNQSKTDDANNKLVRHILIRRNYDGVDDFMEVRVAVVGNVDAGKSTLLGVLTHGILDDGRGEARTKLFRHKHEIESGRTSSVGNDILGFNVNGVEINELKKPSSALVANKALDWEEICKQSSKVITFIDLAGHERYLKTTVFGMTGHSPDYAMLMVGSNMGVIGMTKEHLGLSLALNIPVFVVVTKIDMCPPNILQETLKMLQKILKSPGCRKLAYLIESKSDVIHCANNFTSERLCPIFQVSNVTGQNLDLLKMFLNLLNTRMESNIGDPAEFQIDDIYSVPGVGTVVSGTCFRGRIQVNDTLLLGPDLIGQFRQVTIKGIHRKRMPVKECSGGQTASFALKKLKRSDIRKGMYLISEKLNPAASWIFEAEVLILHHPTTISINYQAMVHCGSVRQTATIIHMSVEHMRTGDKALVRFHFIKNPEYLKPGVKMVFREGRTKAIGTITKANIKKDEP